MNLFFDLDGTLLDSKLRLYNLFQHLVPESYFSFDEYWHLKRAKQTHKIILIKYFNYDTNQINEFLSKWMQLIEKEEWLKFDKPFAGISEYLKQLKKKGHILYVVTHRQNYDKVLQQFENFNWKDLFQEIIVTEQKYTKAELIQPNLMNETNNWIISDSGSDIIEGKKLNMKTAAVLCGFLNLEMLKKYKPDIITNYVIDLKL